MPAKIGVLVFPSVQTAPDRTNDLAGLPQQAALVVDRNQRKHAPGSASTDPLPPARPGHRPDSTRNLPPRSAVFSSGASADPGQAFRALKNAGFQNFDKVYLLAHGGVDGVEKPKLGAGGIIEDFKAPELAAMFMDEGGLRDAMKLALAGALHKPIGGKAEFKTSIRLLSCETGRRPDSPQGLYSTPSADSYARDFANQLGKQALDTLNQLKRQDPSGFEKANLSVEITVAAPRGREVIMPSGETAVYHASSAHQPAADKALEGAYLRSGNKGLLQHNDKATTYLLPDHEKKTVLRVRIDKFPHSSASGQVLES